MGTVVKLEQAYDTAAALRRMQAELEELQSAPARSLQLAIAMGELLAEEKAARKGSFLAWLAEEVTTISQRTAYSYMKLHDHREALKVASVATLTDARRFIAKQGESTPDDTEPKKVDTDSAPKTRAETLANFRRFLADVKRLHDQNLSTSQIAATLNTNPNRVSVAKARLGIAASRAPKADAPSPAPRRSTIYALEAWRDEAECIVDGWKLRAEYLAASLEAATTEERSRLLETLVEARTRMTETINALRKIGAET